MHLHFVVESAQAGDPFVVSLSGPGLPAMLGEQLPGNLTVDKDYPIPKGSGVWQATV